LSTRALAQIVKRIGEGGCGKVYEVRSVRADGNGALAMKVELTMHNKGDQILKMDMHVLRMLEGKSQHVCKVVSARTHGRTGTVCSWAAGVKNGSISLS
jgi:hypothetical protein